ncbi:Fatty acid synthase [Halotydeus destructor]|nr:Fatty acid synthase [Halotydeus destructor]
MESEEIVVSGISVRLPESDNLDEFRDNLLNGEDMVTDKDDRWQKGLWNMPNRKGKIKDLTAFDADLFGIDDKQANVIDPSVRLLLECTFEAILDAGLQPEAVKGKRTGYFLGQFFDEIDGAKTMEDGDVIGYKQLFGQLVGNVFDFKGPNLHFDTACSSTLAAMTESLHYLRKGEIDFAFVAGCNIPLSPSRNLTFKRLNMLSDSGICNYLDAKADGYVKAETVGVILLQRASSAKRNYCTVVHSNSNTDGFKEEGITFPKWTAQCDLLRTTYQEAGVNPEKVVYVEAHGTGTQAGDTMESMSLSKFFCEGKAREEPLLVGSVKSNMGHAEAASAIASLAKVIIAYESEMLPPILHLKTINPDIQSVVDGRLKPVTECTPFKGGYVGLNSFGFGGANNHVILKDNEIKQSKCDLVSCSTIPRLVLLCGRTADAVNHLNSVIADFHFQNKLTAPLISSIDNLSMLPVTPMKFRGSLLISNNNIDVQDLVEVHEKKPLFLIFPGFGVQWDMKAEDFMNIEPFVESVRSSLAFISQHIEVAFELDTEGHQNIALGHIGIAVFQLAITELLNTLGIHPDGYIGHSAGEAMCGYLDGIVSREEFLLTHVHLYKAVQLSKISGAMAVVGLGATELESICPTNIYIACDNAPDLVTIAGLTHDVTDFIQHLHSKGIFAKQIQSGTPAGHSPLVGEINEYFGSQLSTFLSNEPKTTSDKWVRSSETVGCVSVIELFTRNLAQRVLFRQACQVIPDNAIIVEVSPKPFLMSIMKKNVRGTQETVPLFERKQNSNVDSFLNTISELYKSGQNVDVSKLYPPVSHPYPKGTPSLAPLIKLDHSKPRTVRLYPDFFSSQGHATTVSVDISSDEWKFVVGHFIDGRILFPAMGYVYLAWTSISTRLGYQPESLAVEMRDVNIHRATILNGNTKTVFQVLFQEFDHLYRFFIEENNAIVAEGCVMKMLPTGKRLVQLEANGLDTLSTADIYKELRIKGYEYGPTFQLLDNVSLDGRSGEVKCSDWIATSDCMLQIAALSESRCLKLPVSFETIKIYPRSTANEALHETVVYEKSTLSCFSETIEITGAKFVAASKRLNAETDVIEKLVFTKLFETNMQFELSQLQCPLIDLAIENITELKKNVVEMHVGHDAFDDRIASQLARIPSLEHSYKLLSQKIINDLPENVEHVESTSINRA